MPAHFSIKKLDSSDQSQELAFDKSMITIGRDPASDIRLVDPKRVVGRRHARVEEKDGAYRLVDLGSKNLTFLNNERILAGKPYELRDGDQFQIGDFLIQFKSVESVGSVSSLSESARFGSNPLHAECEKLVESLNRLSVVYIAQPPGERRRLLESTLRESLKTPINEEFANAIATYLKPGSGVPPTVQIVPADRGAGSPAWVERLSRVVDLLLEAILRLAKGPSQFRIEFIGITQFESSDPFSISKASAEEVKRLLLDARATEHEMQERLEILRRGGEEALLHQVALLDGYRACVKKGAQTILERLDPEALRREFSSEAFEIGPVRIPYRYIPGLIWWKCIQVLRRRHRDLLAEDQSVLEKRIFRPAFVHGYMTTMDSASAGSGAQETPGDSADHGSIRKRYLGS